MHLHTEECQNMTIDEIKVIKGTERDVIRTLSDLFVETIIEVRIRPLFTSMGFHIFTAMKDHALYLIYYHQFPDMFLFVGECKYACQIELYIQEFYDKYLEGE